MATPQPLADRTQSDSAVCNNIPTHITNPSARATKGHEQSVHSNNAEGSGELTAVVDDLLNQLNNKFTSISSELLSKMDDMSRRLDNLEATMAGDGTKGSGSGK
ncbi:heat shock factor binding 1 [Pyrenophora seminiperda CCB06]|uniref:Heat shock factor binding 1 n=1 Tax=Pyrenophora seminiperda CCB06 TaxID=1302712 RepID=A0A3M7MA07_9PLEO|nr:heat shock factor binding 1 [Pyrenophora seminiperda CCB06]